MRQTNTSSKANNSSRTTAFDKLTKAQLIYLLQGNIKHPITPDELYRAAVSIVAKWCDDVIADRYASMFDVTSRLGSLEKIYKNS